MPFAAIDPTIGIIVVGIIGPILTYLVAARKMTGEVKSSDATELWAESRSIREWSSDRMTDLTSTIVSLETRVEQLEERNESLLTENNRLFARIRELEERVQSMEEYNNSLQKENSDLLLHINNLEETIKGLKSTLKIANNIVESLTETREP